MKIKDPLFWSHVAPVIKSDEQCWRWEAGRNKHGYGRVRRFGRNHYTHRWAWYLATGSFAPSDLDVCHHCDEPSCVNPSHLFLGTAKENITDCVKKGRRAVFKAERNPAAKLTWATVRAIRIEYRPRVIGLDRLAQKYGVDRSLISQVVNRKTWRE